ncbi:hypothetical protein XI03_09620 [Bradyrhizobium sp. CCBAU 65884]|uniref:hypothetical protein n=1 Tax=Bradyrhizobium sp. CCBAU 65884 TaxID=722477 RepID=UPI002305D9A9|nr:hypothetical protein [Bradyrhizobium sp. CCBAU 65884]MDA9474751.1 hypothetical protein [Bradyrhizobium sp. CCBAU 65884]
MVGEIKSERWARSFRNRGRHRAESAEEVIEGKWRLLCHPLDIEKLNGVPQESEWKQKRARQLIEALGEYETACEALRAELGLYEAEDISARAFAPLVAILDRMKEIEPKTLRGLQAKAQMITRWYWDHLPKEASVENMALTLLKGFVTLKAAAWDHERDRKPAGSTASGLFKGRAPIGFRVWDSVDYA